MKIITNIDNVILILHKIRIIYFFYVNFIIYTLLQKFVSIRRGKKIIIVEDKPTEIDIFKNIIITDTINYFYPREYSQIRVVYVQTLHEAKIILSIFLFL